MLPCPPPANEHEQESKLMFSAGDRIGQFRVVREIGQGGMGCVYEVVADENGEVKVRQVTPERPGTRMQFVVPTTGGDIKMVDYSSVDCWKGSHIQTWLPMIR